MIIIGPAPRAVPIWVSGAGACTLRCSRRSLEARLEQIHVPTTESHFVNLVSKVCHEASGWILELLGQEQDLRCGSVDAREDTLKALHNDPISNDFLAQTFDIRSS